MIDPPLKKMVFRPGLYSDATSARTLRREAPGHVACFCQGMGKSAEKK